MTRTITLVAALSLGFGLPSIAIAQSPPGGFLAAATPGGTQGIAGPANLAQAIRGGNAVIPGTIVETDVGPIVTGSVDRSSGWAARHGLSGTR